MVHFFICFLDQHFLGACFAGGCGECVEESALGLRTFQGWQCGTATPTPSPGNRILARVPDCLPAHPHSRTLSSVSGQRAFGVCCDGLSLVP